MESLSAFTDSPDGGNPAGVWIGDGLPDPDDMQRGTAVPIPDPQRSAREAAR